MKKLVLILVLAATHIAVLAQVRTMTLKQCIDTAIANNLGVNQANLLVREAEINMRQARMDRLPNLIGNASYGSNQGRSIDPFSNAFINQQVSYSALGLSSGVVLFNGMSMQNRARQTKLAHEASQMDYQQMKENLTLNVILAYLQVLNSEDQLIQSRQQERFSSQQVDRLQILNKEGAIAPSLLSDLRGQVANDKLSIANNEKAVETAKINLFDLLNIAYDRNVQLERVADTETQTSTTADPMAIYSKAVNELSIIKAASLRRLSAEKGIAVARGRMFPTLSFGANVNTNYSSAAIQNIFLNTVTQVSSDYVVVNGSQVPVTKTVNNFDRQKINYFDQLNNNLFTGVNLTLSVPIFNRLRARNDVKFAQLNYKNTELIEKDAKNALQLDVQRAFVNMQTAEENYKTLQEQVQAYEESFRAAEIRFNNGVGNSIDYLTAKNNLDRANTNLISARFDVILRKKILDYYQGNPLW